MPRVNPAVLVWARETAGLSAEDAVRKLTITSTRDKEAVDRLLALEAGEAEPTRPLLLKMAKQYRRPLLAFYLSEAPPRGDRGQDFRTLPDARDPGSDAMVDALVRDIHARQQMVRAILDDDEALFLPFIGSKSAKEGATAIADDIKRTMAFDRDNYVRQANPESAFAMLREAVESKGIFVLLIGNLGSHHSAIEPDVFRGFALADPVAPFVVINDQDAKAAWSFTLLHELAHLWLGQTGISGGSQSIGIERFCNEVASQILLPADELCNLEITPRPNLDELTAAISRFARPRNLSYSMVAYRLFAAGLIDSELWDQSRIRFRALWRRERQRARDQARENDESGGPSYYTVRRHRLGKALLSFVRQQMDEGDLTPSKAAKILGVKPRSVATLVWEGDTLLQRGMR